MTQSNAKDRLEYLRGEIEAERISWGELVELQSLAEHIEPGDVQLLEAAGVPEWQGSPCPKDPDNYWINNDTGERIKAS